MIKFNCYNKIEIKFKIISSLEELEELARDTINISGGFLLDSLTQPGLGITEEVDIEFKTVNDKYFKNLFKPYEGLRGLVFRYSIAWFLNSKAALDFVEICKSGKNPLMPERVLYFESPAILIV